MWMKEIYEIDISEFFFSLPLYTKVSVNIDNIHDKQKIEKILGGYYVFNETVEGYNPLRKF